jgi:hypothetical protein
MKVDWKAIDKRVAERVVDLCSGFLLLSGAILAVLIVRIK